jgi:glutamate-ammonia-ligase adenylyltransferase
MVLQAVAKARHTEAVLEHIFNLIRSIHRRTAYLALMLENPSILNHLVTLTGASPWIAQYLCRHPVLLDELVDPRTLYRPPPREDLENELNRRTSAAGMDDLEYWMESMRVFKQINLLRVAASDITSVLPLMKVSDHLTDIAETALTATATLCWEQLKLKYGIPVCRLDDQRCEKGFAIIAYGKLGGLELGYGSDLDLVFLHAAETGQSTGGQRSIDNTTFFTRLGQRVLHMLTTHTGAGILYPVDMRLRPSGDSGMLVSHVDGFAVYQHENAWTWEHQALLRARAVYGDPQLKQRFDQVRREILTLKRDGDRLKSEVAEMRDRLRKENQNTDDNSFDIKQDAGGIMDIEFIVQYLALKYAHDYPQIIHWTDNVRQLQALNEVGILDHTSAFALRRAYLIYRAMAHRLNLKQQDAVVAHDRFLAPRQFVRKVWHRLFQ